MQDLRVAAVQSELVWEDPQANRSHLSELISRNVKEVDLILLPEMFSTAFTMTPQNVDHREHQNTLGWMRELANKYSCVVMGSLVVKENENYYNRLFSISQNEEITYNKHHLFTMAGEEKVYTPGNTNIQVECNQWQLRPLVCYDLRFPVWCRNDSNYDLLCFVANWPEKRIAHWKNLLVSRAIENQAFVIGVNRVGKDANDYQYNGNSMIIAPDGSVLQEIVDTEAVLQESLDYSRIEAFRKSLSALRDRDHFQIN